MIVVWIVILGIITRRRPPVPFDGGVSRGTMASSEVSASGWPFFVLLRASLLHTRARGKRPKQGGVILQQKSPVISGSRPGAQGCFKLHFVTPGSGRGPPK
ncbi:hypothetical protein ES705_11111 [subsurface metagenome]